MRADSEAISFVIQLHKHKRVEVDIAHQMDTGLNTPIILKTKLVREGVLKEKATLESAHMTVRFRPPVDNIGLFHLFPSLGSLVLVDPARIAPVLLGHEPKVNWCAGHLSDTLFKLVGKGDII